MTDYDIIAEFFISKLGLPEEVFEIKLNRESFDFDDGDIEYFKQQEVLVGTSFMNYSYKQNQAEGWEGLDFDLVVQSAEYHLDELRDLLLSEDVDTEGGEENLFYEYPYLRFLSPGIVTLKIDVVEDRMHVDLVKFSD